MSQNTKKANATDIANKLLYLCPNLEHFLEILVKDIDIDIKQVGKRFQYPIAIEDNVLYTSYGIFMDYFIRKHLSQQFKIPLTDDNLELVLKNPQEYFKGPGKTLQLQKDMAKNYIIYKDNKQKPMDILDAIKNVSLATTISFHDPLPKSKIETENSSLREVIKYFENLSYSSLDMKTDVSCEYFDGNADLIFDSNVLYEIKTSKFESLKRRPFFEINVNNFFKLILYGFGYNKKTNKIIKCYKIYNPLLGLEYTLKLEDIDVKHFEEVLKKDTENILKK